SFAPSPALLALATFVLQRFDAGEVQACECALQLIHARGMPTHLGDETLAEDHRVLSGLRRVVPLLVHQTAILVISLFIAGAGFLVLLDAGPAGEHHDALRAADVGDLDRERRAGIPAIFRFALAHLHAERVVALGGNGLARQARERLRQQRLHAIRRQRLDFATPERRAQHAADRLALRFRVAGLLRGLHLLARLLHLLAPLLELAEPAVRVELHIRGVARATSREAAACQHARAHHAAGDEADDPAHHDGDDHHDGGVA